MAETESKPPQAATPEGTTSQPQEQTGITLPREHPTPNKAPGPGCGRRLWRAFVFLLKLFLFLVFIVAVVAGIYLGWPVVYKGYILPVQNHTVQIATLESRQGRSDQQLATAQSGLKAIGTEQARQAQSLARLDTSLGAAESEIAAHSKSLADLQDEIAAHTRSLAALEEMQATLKADKDATLAEVNRQISLMKSMELLSRARLFLYQSNFGLAKQDVQIARDILAEVQPAAPLPLGKDLSEVVLRLDLALGNLPDFPVAASDDLDIARRILLLGIPQPPAAGETPTPASLPENTATPTILPSNTPTPTPEATLTPTATP